MKPKKTESMTAAQFQAFHQKQLRARDSKFGAVPRQNAEGEKYRSGVELRYHRKLKLLQLAGDVVKIQREVTYEFVVNDYQVGSYILDFIVTYADGRVEYIDTKSKATLTALFKLKQALMLACHGITVVAVFEEEQK